MSHMIDMIKAKRGNVLKPVVVTCDPARDTPPVLKSYLSDFHPDMIGLTGTWEQVRAMCKSYRVYFSTPKHAPGQDYLVDHSIYFYLMGVYPPDCSGSSKATLIVKRNADPDGDFIEVIGREHTAEKGAKLVADHIGDWDGPVDRG